MPEGDSIHRLAAQIGSVLTGRKVTALAAHTIDDAAARSLVGHEIVEVAARGKNLLVRFDDGRALHVHLRMLGRLRLERPRSPFYAPRRTTPQLRLAVDGAAIVGDRIPVLRLLAAGAEERVPELSRLGPDLVRADFDEDEALRRVRALGALPIGEALLIQSAASGIGNIYKSEVLFIECIDPRAPTSALEDATLLRLLRCAAELLRKNLGTGPRVTRRSLSGPRLWVYDRRSLPCLRCRTPIATMRQGAAPGRTTFYCPGCQQ